MGRPRKAAEINRAPFDAEATLSGPEVKEMLREKRLENEERTEKYRTLKTIRELLQTPIVVKDFPVQELKGITPEAGDWGVSYYFPVAKDAEGKTVPTYVDAPVTDRQRQLCERKAEIFAKLGKAYYVYTGNTVISAEKFRASLDAMGDDMMREGQIVTL